MDRESDSDSYSPDLSVLQENLISKVNSSDVVIVSDYGKGFVSDELFSLVRNNAKFVSVDPKPSRLLQYESPDLINSKSNGSP